MILFLSMKCHSYILSLIFYKLFFRLIFKTILFFFSCFDVIYKNTSTKMEYRIINCKSLNVNRRVMRKMQKSKRVVIHRSKDHATFFVYMLNAEQKIEYGKLQQLGRVCIHNTGKWFETYLTKINVNKTWPILFYIIKHCELFLFRITRQLTMLNLV